MKLPDKEHIIIPTALVLFLVAIHALNLKEATSTCLGIQPYHLSGLKGVLLAPLLHSDIFHLMSNIFPLWALLFLSFQYFGKMTYWVLIMGWICTGLMVWAFPFPNTPYYSSSCHIGASGLVYVFSFFLLLSSVFNKKRSLDVLALIVVVSFGSMVWGIIPEEFFGVKDSNISWQSHLSGAIVGSILSYMMRGKSTVVEKKFEWEGKEELSEKDQRLWDTYNQILREQEEEEMFQKWQEDLQRYYDENNQSST